MTEEKRPVGRPLKYSNPEDMQVLIDRYFEDCEARAIRWSYISLAKPVPAEYERNNWITRDTYPTVTGLSLVLDLTRKSLIEYEGRPEFVNTIKRAKTEIEAASEQRLCNPSCTGTIFSLKNNYGWNDKTEIDTIISGTLTTKTLKVTGYGPTDQDPESPDTPSGT